MNGGQGCVLQMTQLTVRPQEKEEESVGSVGDKKQQGL